LVAHARFHCLSSAFLCDHARNPVVTRAVKGWDAGGMGEIRQAAVTTLRPAEVRAFQIEGQTVRCTCHAM